MTPCQDPGNNPDDWFISRDGKQYSDDVLVSDADVEAFLAAEPMDAEGYLLNEAEAREILEAEAVRAALIRRRHAKDKCFTECPARMACLSLALNLDDPMMPTTDHGTFGGYYEEERREILRARAARQNRP